MKRILILLFTLIQITLLANSAAGQTVESLRLKRDYYYDNLDKIIDAIGKDLNIRFVYDREHLKKTLWSTLERHSGRGGAKRLSVHAPQEDTLEHPGTPFRRQCQEVKRAYPLGMPSWSISAYLTSSAGHRLSTPTPPRMSSNAAKCT